MDRSFFCDSESGAPGDLFGSHHQQGQSEEEPFADHVLSSAGDNAASSVRALLKQVDEEFQRVHRENAQLREELNGYRPPECQQATLDPEKQGQQLALVQREVSFDAEVQHDSFAESMFQPPDRSEMRKSEMRKSCGMRFTEFLADENFGGRDGGGGGGEQPGRRVSCVPAPFSRPSVSAFSFMGTGGASAIADSIAASDVAALWPASVELREEYQDVSHGASRKMNSDDYVAGTGELTSRSTTFKRYSETDAGPVEWFNSGVLHPDSTRMICIDTVGVVMVINELLITPFVLAWEIPIEGGLRVVMWLSGFFWLVDFILCFNKGFYRAGQLHMQRSAIILNYIRGWLLPDLALVVADALAMTLNEKGEDSPVLRVVRACRLMKVLRITRLFRFLERAMTLSLSWRVRFGLQISSMAFITILLNHLLCCLWWVIGIHGPSDTGIRWPETFDDPEAGLVWNYVTALHWTIAQMTLGSTDVMPVNSCERIFTVLLLIIALLFGSTLVSWISALVVQVVMSRGDRTGKLNNLRQYLRQEHVPAFLSAEVQRQAIDRLGQQENIDENNVVALEMLSRSLRLELIYATRMPLVMQHPLFRVWGQMDARALKVMCRECLNIKILRPEDDLFLAGEVAEFAFYLSEGNLTYVQRPSFAMVDEDVNTVANAGSWLCEAALWCQWRHMGNCTATTSCKLLTINAEALSEVVHMKSSIESTTLLYAKKYHERLTLAIPPHAPWPNDLHVPFTETSDLLSKDVELNLLGLALNNGKLELSQNQRIMLQNELSQGKCCLQCDKQDNLVRIVALVALQIQRDNGDIFAQVGSWSDESGAKAACQLPGTKRQRGELPHQAVRRLVFDDLPSMDNVLIFEGFEHSVDSAPSPKYGVDTTYLKAVQIAAVAGEDDFPELTTAPCRTELIDHSAISVLGDIFPRDVYVLPDSKKKLLYSWLHPEQFERLRKPENVGALSAWLNALEVMPDDIEEALEVMPDDIEEVEGSIAFF